MTQRLVTIPISHFCEKARWALDRAGVRYVEQPHLQIIHVLAARFAGGGRTVPVLVTDAGEVLADSTEILRWGDTQIEPELRLYPDGPLGEAGGGAGSSAGSAVRTRRTAVALPRDPAGRPPAGRRGRWSASRAGSGCAFEPPGRLSASSIRRFLGVDAGAARTALVRIDDVFDDVAERLSDGRRFLIGDRVTAADLTFAALAAPMLIPRHYGSPLPPPEVMPPGFVQEMQRLRAHPGTHLPSGYIARNEGRLT